MPLFCLSKLHVIVLSERKQNVNSCRLHPSVIQCSALYNIRRMLNNIIWLMALYQSCSLSNTVEMTSDQWFLLVLGNIVHFPSFFSYKNADFKSKKITLRETKKAEIRVNAENFHACYSFVHRMSEQKSLKSFKGRNILMPDLFNYSFFIYYLFIHLLISHFHY